MAYSKTLKGRYFDILGHFFSIYCIYKIFMVRHIYSLIDTGNVIMPLLYSVS